MPAMPGRSDGEAGRTRERAQGYDTHVFVVLEGFDGVGKSTAAAMLAERLGASLYRTPSGPYQSIRQDIDLHAAFAERALFYAAAVTRASAEIERLLELTHVVCDRYLRSTVAYHAPVWPMANLLRELPVREPDLTVVLTADEADREARVCARDGDAPSRWCDAQHIREQIQAQLKEQPCLVIDTTRLDQHGVVDMIVRELQARGFRGERC